MLYDQHAPAPAPNPSPGKKNERIAAAMLVAFLAFLLGIYVAA